MDKEDQIKADLTSARRDAGCFEYRGYTVVFGGIRMPFNMFFEFGVWYATKEKVIYGSILYATTSGCVGTVGRIDEPFNWYPQSLEGTLLGQSPQQRDKMIHAAGLRLLSHIDNVVDKGKAGG